MKFKNVVKFGAHMHISPCPVTYMYAYSTILILPQDSPGICSYIRSYSCLDINTELIQAINNVECTVDSDHSENAIKDSSQCSPNNASSIEEVNKTLYVH